MHKKIIFFLLLFFQFLYCVAQKIPVEDVIDSSQILMDDENKNDLNTGFAKEVKGDTSLIFNALIVNADSVTAWKNKNEYRWINNIDSFLIDGKKKAEQETKITIRENAGISFMDSFFRSGILQTLLWLAAIALVLFIVYKLFLSQGIFTKRYKKSKVEIAADEEDITAANDYDLLLSSAYKSGDLKLAMRYLFLKTLKKLNEKEMINFAVDKTNSQYTKEIPVAKRNIFSELALYYEYSWYGNAPLTTEIFNAIEIKFNDFLNRL